MTNRENYNKIFENGVLHINVAKILANNNSFGFGISHLVLGIEELIKYQVVQIQSVDTTVFEKELNPESSKNIFRNHGTKHNLIKEFQESVAPEFGDIFNEYVFYSVIGEPLKQEHLTVVKNRFKEIGNFLGSAYQEINIPVEERPKFFNWLKKANNFKNEGFYVNLINGVCESPSKIKKEEFETALKYAEAILMQTEIIKSLDITEDELIELLNTEVIVDKGGSNKNNKY